MNLYPPFWQRNGLALVSLFIALSSLAYNTWRNETTERHRNVRQAAFRSLEELGELQIIINMRYQGDPTRGNFVGGWGRVSLVHDLCDLLPAPSPAAGDQLLAVWQANFEAWSSGSDEAAEERIDEAIAATRAALLANLHDLR
jgi:hypothetical protein